MSDTVLAASPVAVAVGAEKKVVKKTAGAAKKPSATPAHPPTQEMVDASIKTLKERGGSSLLAIKKYIAATYKVDVQKLAPFIKKYLKNGVVSGKLIQTKGKGASGSFKLSAAASKEPKAPKAKSSEKKKAVTAAKKNPATAVKKVTASSGEKKVKKSAATKKVVEKKKTEKAKAKTIKKAGGAVKAKTPKPKAAASSVKAKAAAKPKAVTAPAVKPKKVATAAKKAALKK